MDCDNCGAPFKERIVGEIINLSWREDVDKVYKERFYGKRPYERLLACSKCTFGRRPTEGEWREGN